MERKKKKGNRKGREEVAHSGMENYLAKINEEKLLSPEEEIDLARRVQEGDSEARNQLVVANLRLVVRVAKMFAGRGWHLDDLIEEGNVGLLKAAERYRAEPGIRFSTYANYWIQQNIRRAMVDSSKLIRLPAYMVEIVGRWRRASILLEEDLHRTPLTEEIARRIGVQKHRLPLIFMALSAYTTAPAPENTEFTGANPFFVRMGEKSPDETCSEKDALEKVQLELEKLPERVREVLQMRYGLIDGHEYTLREVGQRLKITRERVRQIEQDGIDMLGEKMV